MSGVLMDNVKTKVWIMCEAFTLTGDAFGHQTVHESLTPYAVACADKNACLKALRKAVDESVSANYEGLDDDDVNERIASDIRDVLSNPERRGRGVWQYNYSTDDREVVWRIYPIEVRR